MPTISLAGERRRINRTSRNWRATAQTLFTTGEAVIRTRPYSSGPHDRSVLFLPLTFTIVRYFVTSSPGVHGSFLLGQGRDLVYGVGIWRVWQQTATHRRTSCTGPRGLLGGKLRSFGLDWRNFVCRISDWGPYYYAVGLRGVQAHANGETFWSYRLLRHIWGG